MSLGAVIECIACPLGVYFLFYLPFPRLGIFGAFSGQPGNVFCKKKRQHKNDINAMASAKVYF